MSARGREPDSRSDHSRLLSMLSWDWCAVICPIVFVAFPLALLWRPLFAGEAFFWGTPLLQFIPWQQLAADMWRSGHLPLWNPLVGCGAPLAANYQTAAFYPLNALYLLMPAEVAMSWTTALHITLAGWGMYRWGRAVGLDRFPAFVGGLALQGSGFLLGRAALFPSIAITYPWVPIWLWRVELLVHHQGNRAASSNVGHRDTVWLGITIGLGLLAGHAQTAFYGALLTAAYAALRIIQHLWTKRPDPVKRDRGQTSDEQGIREARYVVRSTGRIALMLLLSLVIGLGLAAVQLLPTAELLLHSQRSTGVTDDLAMTYSFWPWRLITLLAPGFFGNPGAGNYWGYGAHWEDVAYIGLLPLLLAARAVIQSVSRRRRSVQSGGPRPAVPGPMADRPLTGFWVISAVVSLVLALGKNTFVFPFLFHHMPGFDLFQAPARWVALTTVALAALAGIGAQRWPEGLHARQRGGLGVAVGGALLIGGLAAPRIISSIPSTFGPATARLGSILILTSVLLLLGERARRRRGKHAIWWRAAFGAFIALDLLTFAQPLVPTVDRSLYRGDTQTAKKLSGDRNQVRVYWPSDPTHQNQAYDAQYRVKFDYLTFDDFGPDRARYWRGMREDQLPNAGMLDGIPSANNFEPLLVERYADLLKAAVQTPRVLDVMGVTHVATDRSWPDAEQVHRGESVAFYRLPGAPGRAWLVPYAHRVPSDQILAAMENPSFDPTKSVLVERDSEKESSRVCPPGTTRDVAGSSLALRDGPNRVTIDVVLDTPGYLVLADTWYPGWRATVDGEPAELLRANHAFRTVCLTAGEHIVEMIYRPASVLVGGAVSLATGALLILRLLMSRREKA